MQKRGMLRSILMASVVLCFNLVSRSAFRTSSTQRPLVRMMVSRRHGRPNDFIDVEEVDKSAEGGRAGGENFENQEGLSRENKETKGLLSGIGGFLASKIPVLNLINKKEDKESIQKREVMSDHNPDLNSYLSLPCS